MLVLTRKEGEWLWIGDEIKVCIVRVENDKVRVGIECPTEIRIQRDELLTNPRKNR